MEKIKRRGNILLYKKRKKSITYLVLEALNSRMKLTNIEKINYKNQLKGFDGECQFDSYMEQVSKNGILLNDLVLNSNHSIFQIDSLFILGKTIYLYEVKNYSGTYHYQESSFLSGSGYEITNPVNQLNRSKILLNNLLKKYQFDFHLEGYVVFIDSAFELFYLPPHLPFLFYNQLTPHVKILKSQNYQIDNEQIKLANKLEELHDEKYRSDNLPVYTFDELKKGSYCPICFSYEYKSTRQQRFCTNCGHKEKTIDTIKRSIDEFKVLFPKEKLTTQKIYYWCGGEYLKPRIRRVLKKFYKAHGELNGTYYE